MAKTTAANAQYDQMTSGAIVPLILRLAVPTTISMLVSSVYNLADTAFVGRLGTSASGAVGVVFGYMSIIQAFGFMFGQGTGSNVARLLGRRETDRASAYTSTGFFLAFSSGLVIALLSIIFLDPLVRFLGSTETIAPYAKTYISFILAAAPFMCASFTMNQVLRFEGKAALAMVGLLIGAALNIAGDALFMVVFDMGITGAGLSTAISEFVSFLVLLSMFLMGRSTTHISPRRVSLDAHTLTEIVGTGFPSMLRQGLTAVTTMLLNASAAVYGDAAIAAMSIVSRVIFFVFSLALGVGQGFQPVCGFNYGAGHYGRVRKAYRATLAICEILMVVSVFVLLLFAGSIVQLFRDDPQVIEIGTRALRVQALSLLVIPVSMVTEMLYQSAGKKLGATMISALRGGVIFIPAIIILSHLRGLKGIQEAQAVAYFLVVPPAIVYARVFFSSLSHEESPLTRTNQP